MKNINIRKGIIFAIIVLFLGIAFTNITSSLKTNTKADNLDPPEPKGRVWGPAIFRKISADIPKKGGYVYEKGRSISFGFGPYMEGKVELKILWSSITFRSGRYHNDMGSAIYVMVKWFFGTIKYTDDRILIDGFGFNVMLIQDLLIIPENVTLNPIDDAYVDKLNSTQNFGDKDQIEVADHGDTEAAISYLKFDLSGIPTSKTIYYALFNLYYCDYEGAGKAEVGLYKVNTSWDEDTITWENKPDFSTTYEDSRLFGPSDPCMSEWWDITDLVKGWTNGSIPNNGIALKICTPGDGDITRRMFKSKEWSIKEECNRRKANNI